MNVKGFQETIYHEISATSAALGFDAEHAQNMIRSLLKFDQLWMWKKIDARYTKNGFEGVQSHEEFKNLSNKSHQTFENIPELLK